MNIKLHLNNADLQFWKDEFPTIEKIENKIETIEVNKKSNAQKEYNCHKLALEVYLHKNAGNYALLGLEYVPDDTESLKININYVVENQTNYESDLTKYNSYKYIGLPEECKDIIVEAIKNIEDIGSGILTIPIAVNCEVGSSPLIFEKVLKLLLEIVNNEGDNSNMEFRMKNLFQKYFIDN